MGKWNKNKLIWNQYEKHYFFLLPIVTWPRLRSTFKLKKKQKQEENMKKKPNHFLDDEETFSENWSSDLTKMRMSSLLKYALHH